jgi:hypothetical protein
LIKAGVDQWDQIETVLTRADRALLASRFIRDFHGCIRNDSALRIGDQAGNLTGGLSARGGRNKHSAEQRYENNNSIHDTPKHMKTSWTRSGWPWFKARPNSTWMLRVYVVGRS